MIKIDLIYNYILSGNFEKIKEIGLSCLEHYRAEGTSIEKLVKYLLGVCTLEDVKKLIKELEEKNLINGNKDETIIQILLKNLESDKISSVAKEIIRYTLFFNDIKEDIQNELCEKLEINDIKFLIDNNCLIKIKRGDIKKELLEKFPPTGKILKYTQATKLELRNNFISSKLASKIIKKYLILYLDGNELYNFIKRGGLLYYNKDKIFQRNLLNKFTLKQLNDLIAERIFFGNYLPLIINPRLELFIELEPEAIMSLIKMRCFFQMSDKELRINLLKKLKEQNVKNLIEHGAFNDCNRTCFSFEIEEETLLFNKLKFESIKEVLCKKVIKNHISINNENVLRLLNKFVLYFDGLQIYHLISKCDYFSKIHDEKLINKLINKLYHSSAAYSINKGDKKCYSSKLDTLIKNKKDIEIIKFMLKDEIEYKKCKKKPIFLKSSKLFLSNRLLESSKKIIEDNKNLFDEYQSFLRNMKIFLDLKYINKEFYYVINNKNIDVSQDTSSTFSKKIKNLIKKIKKTKSVKKSDAIFQKELPTDCLVEILSYCVPKPPQNNVFVKKYLEKNSKNISYRMREVFKRAKPTSQYYIQYS